MTEREQPKSRPDDPLGEPKRMLSLFGVGQSQSTWMPRELGAILRHQLDTPLRSEVDSSIELSGEWLNDGATVRRLLAHPSPPIELLDHFKRNFKNASQAAEGALPKEVATVLYIAVIVAARRTGHQLSSLEDESLREKVEWATRRRWLDPDLAGFFKR